MTATTRFSFQTQHVQGKARAGEFATPHGRVKTPVFMPVGTQATVKALTPDEVSGLGAEIILSNAYHLYLRPGVDLINQFGGAQRFMAWDRPMLTDSGGFQAFSLGALRKVDDTGIRFRSHLDGSEHFFSPERATRNQELIGADIIMCLDQCIAYGESKDAVRQAMERTHCWARECHRVHAASEHAERQALFGIVQGGTFPDLRAESLAAITSIPFEGHAIGGLAVGESKSQMYEMLDLVASQLPADKPRYLMGVGAPEDLVEGVRRGVDMFDCVLPTRVARNGALFTRTGRVDITKQQFAAVNRPLEEDCDCYTCRHFTAAYLWHLFRAKELLALRLASIHNLRFLIRLMSGLRQAIIEGRLEGFCADFHAAYQPTDEASRQRQKEQWIRNMEERTD